MTVIEVGDLSKRFTQGGQDVVALDHVSLSIDAGELVVLTGASGSGKSTLLSIIGGLQRASEGTVVVGGRNFAAASEATLSAARRELIGYVFQDFCLVRHLTALSNVRLPRLFRPKPTGPDRSTDLLARFGLSHRLHHLPAALSRGEMQRVALARALVNDPRIILADEPTANLDGANARVIWDYLHELNASSGLTIVVATHSADWVRSGHRRIAIENGQLRD